MPDGAAAVPEAPGARWTGTVHVGPHRVAVDVHGHRPSLLLINGLGCGRSVWEPLRAVLPPELGTIAYDAPGCGDSGPAPGHMSVAAHAALAAGVARELGLTELDVLGFSFGGMVAQQMAGEHSDLVRRLILLSTSCGVGSWPGSTVALTLLAWPHLMSSRAAARSLGPHVFGGEAAAADRYLALSGTRPHARAYTSQLLAGAAWSSIPWVAGLRQRTLVVAGDRDPLVPVINAAALSALVRRAELHLVRGAGHLVLVDRAAEVASAVAQFLELSDDASRVPIG